MVNTPLNGPILLTGQILLTGKILLASQTLLSEKGGCGSYSSTGVCWSITGYLLALVGLVKQNLAYPGQKVVKGGQKDKESK
jgi:hypothetical protein